MLCGPLSPLGTLGSPQGTPRPRDTPVATSTGWCHPACSATPPAVPPLSWCSGDQQPGQGPNSAINSEKHQFQELFSLCFIFAGP